MKDTFLYVLFITAIVALFAFAFSFPQDKGQGGKQIFIDSKCNNCHTVTSNDIQSKKDNAVDLSNAGNSGDTQTLKSFLLKEAQINNKDHKVKFKGSDAELNTLAEWLSSLKTEQKK